MFLKRKEAAIRLGIEPKTLDAWVDRAGMAYARDEVDLDRRLRLLTEEQIQTLADLHEKALSAPEDHLAWNALWEAVQGLERRLAALERGLAPERVVASYSAPAPRRRDVSEPGAHDTFPRGWMAVSRFCELHHVHARSMDRPITRGEVPAPEQGEWRRGIYVIRRAWRGEQLAAVAGAAGRLWPERFRPCALCPHTSEEATEAQETADD